NDEVAVLVVDIFREKLCDPIDGVGIARVVALGGQIERLLARAARRFSRKESDLDHVVQYLVDAGARELHAMRRRVFRRRLKQAREERSLRQRHIARRPAEIVLRGGLNAIGAAAEIDTVDVELEDLVLAKALLEPDRVDHLLELARHRAL